MTKVEGNLTEVALKFIANAMFRIPSMAFYKTSSSPKNVHKLAIALRGHEMVQNQSIFRDKLFPT